MPRYPTRPENPDPVRLGERDKQILETIYAFDGIISLEQIERLFFPEQEGARGRVRTWPRERMRQLFYNRYVNMPNAEDAHKVPRGETIYFLDVEGAKIVAGRRGETLREISWRDEPRWSLIEHDLKVNDFRIDVIQAVEANPALTLQRWIPEGEFRAHPDKIRYQTKKGSERTRQMIPDGFFTIRRPLPEDPARMEERAFLLEIDMGTEDNPRFGRQKVRPGVAYLHSQAYRERFGIDYGRWLVVTTGEIRMENMKAQTERSGGSGFFYFTVFEQISPETVLAGEIWELAGGKGRTSIVPER